MYHLSAVLTHLPLIPFTTEEMTGWSIEAAKSANKASRNPPSWFTVSVTPSINAFESYDFVILMISFIFSFELNKVYPFPALTAPFSIIFLSNLFFAFEVKLVTNSGKLSLPERIAIIVSAFFLTLPKQEP